MKIISKNTLKNTSPPQQLLLLNFTIDILIEEKACQLAWNVSASSLFLVWKSKWPEQISTLLHQIPRAPSHIFLFFFLVGWTRLCFNFNTFFKHIFMHAFTQNTHRNTLDKRKSLATVSRIQTEPRRWTDGEMGTGSLKSHISIYICCLTGESVTAKPNKQLLAKHTHARPNPTMLSLHFAHTPSLWSHSNIAFQHTRTGFVSNCYHPSLQDWCYYCLQLQQN